MKKRLFIAINFPENIKDKIEKALEKIKHLFTDDVRFIGRAQWHITVTFLGYQGDEFLHPVIKAMEKAVKNLPAQKIEFADLDYGPKGGPKRMLWLNAAPETSKLLAVIKEDLENDLMDQGVIFKKEHRQFRVHITLARFLTRQNLPEIARPLPLNFEADSLDMMESHLKRAGAEYEILQKIPFTEYNE